MYGLQRINEIGFYIAYIKKYTISEMIKSLYSQENEINIWGKVIKQLIMKDFFKALS